MKKTSKPSTNLTDIINTNPQASAASQLKARLFGVFFILTFLSYGIGSGITSSIALAPDSIASVVSSQKLFTLGVVLMAFSHTVFNLLLAAIMFSVLYAYGQAISKAYFALAITATTVLVVGGVFLLMLIPMSQAYQVQSDNPTFLAIHKTLNYGAFVSYQLGMSLWGVGGLLLAYLLYRSNLVPTFFALFGAVGYLIFVVGTVGELFGFPYGVALSIPGGLFEISLSIWLIIKGFRS